MRLQSAETLKALIRQRGMTQTRVATEAGCSASFVNSLCIGSKTSCTERLAIRIAEVLEVPTAILFVPTASPRAIRNIPEPDRSGEAVA